MRFAVEMPVALARGRAFLIFPGDDGRKREQALASGADGAILDLEDGVRPDGKDVARLALGDFVAEAGRPARLVRVNDPSTEVGCRDLEAVAGLTGSLAVVVPKARLDSVARAAQAGHPLVALVEDAIGLRDAFELAAHPAVVALALGSADLRSSLRLVPDVAGNELLFARSQVVVASAAAGIRSPLDGPCLAVRDDDAVGREARTARGLGLGGKLCIHPAQVAWVHRAFAPTADEVAAARAVVAEWERITAQGLAVGVVDGMLVDLPVAERAQAILDAREGSDT